METVWCQECGKPTETHEEDNPLCDACRAYFVVYDGAVYFETPHDI
jgi:hypothetical protein